MWFLGWVAVIHYTHNAKNDDKRQIFNDTNITEWNIQSDFIWI